MSGLYLDLSPGDSIVLENGMVITLEHKSGRRARLCLRGDGAARLKRTTSAESAPPENCCLEAAHDAAA